MCEEEYDDYDYDEQLDLVDSRDNTKYGVRLGEGFIMMESMDINRGRTRANQRVTDAYYAGERAVESIRSVH